jgi:hypothetical protein
MSLRLTLSRAAFGALGAIVIGGAGPLPKAAIEVDWSILSQTTDRKIGQSWVAKFPPRVEHLNGKRIRISGHVVGPITHGGRELLLAAHEPGCTCALCAIAASSLYADVRMKSPSNAADGHISVEGILRLIRSGDGALYYRLDEAEILDQRPAS